MEMPDSALSALSISALKAILFTNHVTYGLILEKGDLIAKVRALIEDEKHERERRRAQEEAEVELQRQLLEERRREEREREIEETSRNSEDYETASKTVELNEAEDTHSDGPAPSSSSSSSSPPPPPPKTPPKTPPKALGTAADLERTGLCVICQDEEANIAIVDCGHLAMCRGCSDLIMASSRECPLCRTRIVTEARLLRIFKT